MELFLRTKTIAVRGSVALKLMGILDDGSKIRLMDQCMSITAAKYLQSVIVAGVKAHDGRITLTGPLSQENTRATDHSPYRSDPADQ